MRLTAAMALVGGLYLLWISAGVAAAGSETYSAVARPWREVDLSFSRPGRVAKVFIHRGDVVKAGELLARQDDRQQVIAARMAELSARSQLRIEAAQAELAQDQISLKEILWAAGKHAATTFEVQRARLKVTIDKLSLQLAELRHQRDVERWKAAQLAVKRRELTAPFAGVIEDRYVHGGQSVAAFKKVVQLVQINRLRIMVPVPLRTAIHIHVGERAHVVPAAGTLGRGVVRWIAKLTNSGSDTLMVEVVVNNPHLAPAGQEVQVRFDPPISGDAALESRDHAAVAAHREKSGRH